MAIKCIKHPREEMSFNVCSKCLESIPSNVRDEVIAAICDEYETHNQLAEKCRATSRAVNG